ncbi:hypothetical protein IMSAG192_00313 [Muribaculaceae bacterium]|nr:hypothetical protein IMSAG192_00313 [Muribaculaceae bacterium]
MMMGEFLFFTIAVVKLRARQRYFGSRARSFLTEFSHCHIGGPLGHQTVCHELSAGNGDEALYAVAYGMIQTHDASRYRAP